MLISFCQIFQTKTRFLQWYVQLLVVCTTIIKLPQVIVNNGQTAAA